MQSFGRASLSRHASGLEGSDKVIVCSKGVMRWRFSVTPCIQVVLEGRVMLEKRITRRCYLYSQAHGFGQRSGAHARQRCDARKVYDDG